MALVLWDLVPNNNNNNKLRLLANLSNNNSPLLVVLEELPKPLLLNHFLLGKLHLLREEGVLGAAGLAQVQVLDSLHNSSSSSSSNLSVDSEQLHKHRL